jgi:hydrogenase nickel incorporation protein HypA/HybF
VVRRVSLRVGHFRQVVPDTLQHCWRLHTDGGPLDGCELAVAWIPAVVRCAACGANTQLERPILRCGTCRSSDVVLVSGEEFLIESIDVAQEVG